jgi:hypothetical protein
MGTASRVGTNSKARHYELSSVTDRRLQSRTTTNIVGGTRKGNDSEDELVKQDRSMTSGLHMLGDDKMSIAVNTTFDIRSEMYVDSPRGKGVNAF